MGVDQLDSPLAQPKELYTISGRILQRFHTAVGWAKVKSQLIQGISVLFMARCWEMYWKNKIMVKNEQP